MNTADIKVGYKMLVKKETVTHKAEILGIRKSKIQKNDGITDGLEFYVHYIELNRRLDEWVSQSCLVLDVSTVEIPKKKKKCDTKDDNKDQESKEEEYKIKNIKKIKFGKYIVEPWYFSPYPKWIAESEIVYICEYCLYYFNSAETYETHRTTCDVKHPPGREIYRDTNISFFELDGYTEQKYCRNLALLSKLFLDHKSLYYDIDVFLFYVLCSVSANGFSVVGYFSKEKISEQGYNLACILTLPFEQRKGYGRILMDFSYMLSKKDNLISGPEKPLSDLGLLSYRAYWLEVIIGYILDKCSSEVSNESTGILLVQQQSHKPDATYEHPKKSSINTNRLSIDEISKSTYISVEDIINTLNHYEILKFYKGKLIFALTEDCKTRALKFKKKRLNEKLLRL